MRKPLVAGNWKMFTDLSSAENLSSELKSKMAGYNWADLVVCPPFTSLFKVVSILGGSGIEIGGQNLHWENEGAYTGEVSGSMLKSAGCLWVIIGHSERRAYFGETDENVARKANAALKNDLKPIVCVGESLEQREMGITGDIVKGQLMGGLGGFSGLEGITIAYEPVWAIGTGRTATPQQAQEVHLLLRGLIRQKWGDQPADSVRILYGGSVKPENAAELWSEEDIDGFLVGGASLKAESFANIAEAVK
jgi:triosephosphate isomerase